jgi:hypothetical protein
MRIRMGVHRASHKLKRSEMARSVVAAGLCHGLKQAPLLAGCTLSARHGEAASLAAAS